MPSRRPLSPGRFPRRSWSRAFCRNAVSAIARILSSRRLVVALLNVHDASENRRPRQKPRHSISPSLRSAHHVGLVNGLHRARLRSSSTLLVGHAQPYLVTPSESFVGGTDQ